MKRLLAGAVVLALAAAVLLFVPSDHYLFVPDPARAVDPLVEVPDEPANDGTEGGVYMVDILVRKASLAERLFPGLVEGSSLVRPEEFNPQGTPEPQRRRESLNQMSRSQEIAVTVALRSLGYDVEVDQQGAEVESVLPGEPADGKLEAGDVIVRARGRTIRTRDDLLRAMEPVRPGDTVELTIRREEKPREIRVGTAAADDDADRAVFGITVVQAAEFDFPIDVAIDAGDVGGPSAGLAFALDVVDELGRDIDKGRRIAVTGTLELDGTVGVIGGIKQKTIGARRADADVFLVPDENAAEAELHAEGLRIVPVSTFREALSHLATD